MPLRSQHFRSSVRARSAADNRPPMTQGERGEGVKLLQEALLHVGRELPRSTAGGNGPADGIYGMETKAEVTRFQRDRGLFVDGVAGRQTFGLLDQLMDEQEREAAAIGDSGDWEMTTARDVVD